MRVPRTGQAPERVIRPTPTGIEQPCPKCSSQSIARILYGFPALSDELWAAGAAGEVRIGGCMPGPDNRACNACGHRFRKV